MYSRVFLFSNYLKKIFRSKNRIILTLLGLIISVVVLFTSLVYIESCMTSILAETNAYRDRKISIINGRYDYQLYNDIKQADFDNISLFLPLQSAHRLTELQLQNTPVYIFIRNVRVSNMGLVFLCDEQGERYDAQLLHGRLISREDINNKAPVVVVPELLANVLFGQSDAIGQKIRIPIMEIDKRTNLLTTSRYEELEIVGVISSSAKAEKEFKKSLENGTGENSYYSFTFNIYTPLSVSFMEIANNQYNMEIQVRSSDDESYYLDYGRIIATLTNQKKHSEYTVNNWYTMREQVETDFQNMLSSMKTLLAFLLGISGLCIVNTMFFSVKERINEIGIRKAVGAMNSDIILQFFFEGIIYGLLGGISGVVIGFLLLTYGWFAVDLSSLFYGTLKITPYAVLISILIPTLISALASIFPAMYASKIKITDAIKSE